MKRIAAGLVMSSLLVAGCATEGGEAPSALKFAQQACQTRGAAAVSLSARAAKLDPKYQQLANDEAALAQNEALQSGSDDSDITGVNGVDGTGPGSSVQVLSDCATIAKGFIPGVG